MQIRHIIVKEDFEKAYNILNQKEYPLSFYEYTLKHECFNSQNGNKLVGVFQEDRCLGTISYSVVRDDRVGAILEVKEIHQTHIKAYKALMSYLDSLASQEKCQAIKICKNKAERLNASIFDRLENYLKNLV